MKKNDLATVVLIAAVATLAAFLGANSIFGDPNEDYVTLKYMDVISGDIAAPDPELFNDLAINPTVETYVGRCRPNETWDNKLGKCVSIEVEVETEDDDTENPDCDPNDPTCIPGGDGTNGNDTTDNQDQTNNGQPNSPGQ